MTAAVTGATWLGVPDGGYVAANTIVVGALLYLFTLAQGLGTLKERDRALDSEAS